MHRVLTLCGRAWQRSLLLHVLACAALLPLAGCTSPWEYLQNGFKVGPNFRTPPAPVAADWIDGADLRVRKAPDDLSKWWTVFHDPVLDDMICTAYRQNLTLREAGFRILQARAQYAIAQASLLPQTQFARGNYSWLGQSVETAFARGGGGANSGGAFLGGRNRFFGQWDAGFNLAWELDFWGRFRRAVEAAGDNLNASVAGYDDVLVTMLSDIATLYVQIRVLEQRIKYARENVEVQTDSWKKAEARVKIDADGGLNVAQAIALLKQTEATIPELQIQLRINQNQLCTLLGIPPEDLQSKLGSGPIPTVPPDVVVGIPADLLRRRPDIRRAEYLAAAQCAVIGIAESEFYPAFSLTGTLGWSAEHFKDLFKSSALNGNFGPSFHWNILNYGRIVNNVRLQDARFQELAANYQQTVLVAQQEVENGLITFLKAQQRTALQRESEAAAVKAENLVRPRYERLGAEVYTRVTQLQQLRVQEQDLLAQAEGEIALGLIQIYRGLGGGWQLRCTGCEPAATEKLDTPRKLDNVAPGVLPPPAAPPGPVELHLPEVQTLPPSMRALLGNPTAD